MPAIDFREISEVHIESGEQDRIGLLRAIFFVEVLESICFRHQVEVQMVVKICV